MKHSWLFCVRLCLCGLVLGTAASAVGLPPLICVMLYLPMLWGFWHSRNLHDGFRCAFWISVICAVLHCAEIIPVLRPFLRESVWALVFAACHWIVLACFVDGFWALRTSRGLSRNRSAAAVVFLQILIDTKFLFDSLPILSITVVMYLAATVYLDRAARELDTCDDPPTL